MNKFLKGINPEKVLFFDIEDVRRSKELEVGSREYELYKKKTRDKATDKPLYTEQVVEDYDNRAALKMCYTKIVSIGVGTINKGKVFIKSLEGTEEEIIKQFCEIATSFDFVCGLNVLGFDLPMLVNNGYRYFDVCEVLPDRFVTSGKKPWNLTSVVDLMDVFKGTHYISSSLDELCYHFDLPSPKVDLDGSQVSEEYWTNGLEKINSYVKLDVFACVNLFKKMRFEKAFDSFTNRNNGEVIFVEGIKMEEEPVKKQPKKITKKVTEEELFSKASVLQRIIKCSQISESEKKELTTLLNKKKIAKKDLAIIKEIITRIYISAEMFKADKPEVAARKNQEIKELLANLQK